MVNVPLSGLEICMIQDNTKVVKRSIIHQEVTCKGMPEVMKLERARTITKRPSNLASKLGKESTYADSLR